MNRGLLSGIAKPVTQPSNPKGESKKNNKSTGSHRLVELGVRDEYLVEGEYSSMNNTKEPNTHTEKKDSNMHVPTNKGHIIQLPAPTSSVFDPTVPAQVTTWIPSRVSEPDGTEWRDINKTTWEDVMKKTSINDE